MRQGHKKFFKLLEDCADLHERKNKQYADVNDPLGNFRRGSQICKKFFHPDIQDDPMRLAAAYCIILATKQIDGVIEIIAQNKKDTPDSLQEKLRDVLVYFGIADCIESDRVEKEELSKDWTDRVINKYEKDDDEDFAAFEAMGGLTSEEYAVEFQRIELEDLAKSRLKERLIFNNQVLPE